MCRRWCGLQEDAIAFSNRYAPEHLIVNVADAEAWLPELDNAGSVFLGAHCCLTARMFQCCLWPSSICKSSTSKQPTDTT
jgi:Histidinol dehydrogenase